MIQPPTWRKSSFSISGTNCVELAGTTNHALMRDSKHPDAGHLSFEPGALATLIAAARAGALDQLT